MPRKYSKKLRTTKRRSRRRNSPTFSTSKGVSVVPDRYYAKLKYVSVLPTAFAGSALFTYQFRGNSLYDPNLTAVGHQPRGFDQLATLYKNYKVLGSSVVARFAQNSTGAASSNTVISLCAQADTDVPTGIKALVENPRAKWKVTGPNNGTPPLHLKGYMSTRKILGLTKAQASADDYSSVVGDNPAKGWVWNVSSGTLDQSTPINSEAVIELTYYAVFYGRQNISSS